MLRFHVNVIVEITNDTEAIKVLLLTDQAGNSAEW